MTEENEKKTFKFWAEKNKFKLWNGPINQRLKTYVIKGKR